MSQQLDPVPAKETPPPFWLDGFDGLNVHDDRRSIGDQECSWIENFIPLGKGNARTLWDNGASIYTVTGTTIVYDFPFNIGSTFYRVLFMADGSAKFILSTGVVALSVPAGTFAVTPTLPACAQWGSSGIVFVTSAGYYAYDGTLYIPGDFAPSWLAGIAHFTLTGDTVGFTSPIQNVSSVSNNLVIGMRINGTGLSVGTLITAFVGSPTNTISISLNPNVNAAGTTFTVGWMMPNGIVGTAIEIYQSRVWVFNGAQFSFSAPSNGANFSTAQGGGTTTSTDSFLRVHYMNARQSNGFLYLFADGSINVISNVQTSGSPSTTTMNNQNVDPQTGLGWRDALVPFGRALCFANPTGVYALYGGAAQKISDNIDKLFEKANFSAVTPTMFVCSIYSVRCLGIILNTLDPVLDQQRTLIALWNGQKWFIASQTLVGIFASTVETDGDLQGWANDGTRVYKLFSTPSSSLTKKIQSKLWAGRSNLIFKAVQDAYSEAQDLSSPAAGIVLAGTIDSDIKPPSTFTLQSNLNWVNQAYNPLVFVGGGGPLQFVTSPMGPQAAGAGQMGLRLGITFTSTSPDFTMIGCGMTYREEQFYGH